MNNSFDFDLPRRQSYVAIIIIIYKLYKTLVRQLWPFLILMLFGGNLSENENFVIGIGVLAVLSTIYGIISFFKYFFYIEGDELIVEKGVIKKSKITIPLNRIQSVDFEQNIIHRIFNVVKLKLDTAGSGATELDLNALDMGMAKAFRKRVLVNSDAPIESGNFSSEESTSPVLYHEKSIAEKILEIDVISLLKVGISANHFRSAGILFFFFYWMYENLEDAGFDLEQYKEYIPDQSVLLQSIALVMAFLVIFIVSSFLVSLIRTVLQYYDLKFIREKGRFKISSGLLNKKEVAALDNKVQMVQWSQNVLQKFFKIFELNIRQASSQEVKIKTAINIPGIEIQQIDKVTNYLFDDELENFPEMYKVEAAYFYRNLLYRSLVFIPIIGLLIYFKSYKIPVLFAFIFLYQILSLFLESKKLGISLNKNHIKVHGGSFGQKVSLFYLHKIQALNLKQSIYQRRKGLADLTIMTAGGAVKVPYLDLNIARKIANLSLYTVEKSQKKWM